jgi:hypothetical protein
MIGEDFRAVVMVSTALPLFGDDSNGGFTNQSAASGTAYTVADKVDCGQENNNRTHRNLLSE